MNKRDLNENIQHPTSNIQHPVAAASGIIGGWALYGFMGTLQRTAASLMVAASCWPLGGFSAETLPSESLRLVPFPKEVHLADGGLKLDAALVIRVANIVPARQAAVDLQRELLRHAKGQFRLTASAPSGGQPLMLWLGKKNTSIKKVQQALGSLPEQDEGYALVVTDAFAVVGARHSAGLAHGIQTLRQLVRGNVRDGRLPAVSVRDWPSLRYRGFSDDITRGPSPTPATLEREVDLSALLRMNFFTYYLEHQYAFRKHPLIGPKDGSLKPEELKALVDYADNRGIELIGNQQSFGHFGNILQHEQYKALRETPDILNPMNEQTYQLLDDLYSEQAPLLKSKFFNVCCDETDGLGTGPSKELVQQIGVGGVYTRHMRRLHDLLRDKYGKRMMMWGDIILNHPKNLADIPKDTIMLTWGYDSRASFESQITPFAQSGFEFFVCPGVSCWNRVMPDFQVSVTNIANFVRDGVKQNAMGMVNTTWDDSGSNLAGWNWYGVAWGAECAWNASTTPIEAFNSRVGAVLFGEEGREFGEAVELLGGAHRLPAFKQMEDSAFFEPDLKVWLADPKAVSDAEALRQLVRNAVAKLDAASKSALVDGDILAQFRFGAQRMDLMASRVIEGQMAADAYRKAVAATQPAEASELIESGCAGRISKLRSEYVALKNTYQELWNAENRPYALSGVTGRYDNCIAYCDGFLQRLASADADLKNQRPLPSPAAIGFPSPTPPGGG